MTIKTILDEKAEDTVLVLTDDQKQEILDSQKEISKGLFLGNENLDNDIQGWLNAK